MSLQKPIVAFVLGGPGAGKGTQCEKIVKKFGFVHLSAGELLRNERDSGSKDGNLIQNCIKDGKIVPVEITIALIQKAMEKSSVKKFLVDGFPRNEDNLQGWNNRMTGIVDVKCVLFFDCPEEECIRRIVERGKTSGRSDDNIHSLRKRFNTYKEQTMPIIEHYEKLNLVKRIPATGSPDEVFQDVKEAIDSILN
ncbi:UMP-CMP kinase-like [Xenia sp. Carnegie-2017]|uniref:UMP-CMP kinase-like n=1 Tax=Xenia sp. Carnegie-2017 TaxID=2897299 RepID=UPI001F033FC6|nr:UMP-CMP kinase-like [Xenia sp. Carnegie-2017]